MHQPALHERQLSVELEAVRSHAALRQAEQAEIVMGFMSAKRATGAETVARLHELVRGSQVGADGVNELETIATLLDAGGYNADRIEIDPAVVRGLGYYTGPVFEAELTFEVLDDKGRPRNFGSVAGGGRYDDLVKRFTGQEVPATGVSIGVDRLLAALRAKGRGAVDTAGPVVVTVMDRDRMADYMAMVGAKFCALRSLIFSVGAICQCCTSDRLYHRCNSRLVWLGTKRCKARWAKK